ncbi:hypothetical protein E5S67_05915 [Microcoleus sp. IPMA8]|uniref:Uncharacterized protein n=1 Tax=Microcoleus asticus IPMA8 TaxID=2563858 RepID=A0ABX2D6M6_9CYAN|nr:hypothetical protein [Microcoleus asticus IPMA8]
MGSPAEPGNENFLRVHLQFNNPNIKKNYNLCWRHSKYASVKSIESYQNLKLLENAIKINLEKV